MDRPNLKALVDMAIGNLSRISEAISNINQPLPPKVTKEAREAKALSLMIINKINAIREAEKSAPAKKK